MATPAPERIGSAALTASRWPLVAEQVGAAAGRPLLLLELDDDDLTTATTWTPGAHPVVVVGLEAPGWDGRPPDDHPCDVVLAADDPAVADVVEAVERHPIAATSLAVLLRGAGRLDTEAGLAAESAVYSLLQAGPEFEAWLRRRTVRPAAEDVGPPVLTERDGGRLTITLNRPHRHNAITEPLRAALAGALTVAVVDETVTEVVLRGAGPSFCSGGDLGEFGAFPDPATAHVSRLTRSPARLVHQLRDRITVHLHGACMGAGIEVPAFAGRVLAAADTVISLPELGVGLVPGAGGTVSLPARIGRHRTALLGLAGGELTAATASAWGLVDGLT